MQDAAVDRLSKVLKDPRPEDTSNKQRSLLQTKRTLLHLNMAEGWFSFFLLALVVYSTIWSVQVAGWVDHLGMLTPVTALGLILGIIASKQHRLPSVLMNALAVVLAALIACWLTSAAFYGGDVSVFFKNIQTWILLAFNGGTSSDQSIFLLFILVLGFLLAYTSTWLLYRTRTPWLMLVANAIVLLINLNSIDANYIIFLLLFLGAALLLLLRFNLYESTIRWKRQGLRCSDSLNWEFMQVGAFLSLALLVLSLILPWGYINSNVAQIWSTNNNPWVATQNLWNRLLAVSGNNNPQNHGSFTGQLSLGGNPNLTNTPVFQVKTTGGGQYLMAVNYEQYDGMRSWSNSSPIAIPANANTTFYDGTGEFDLQQVNTTITVLDPPGEDSAYLFGPSEIVSTNQTTQLVTSKLLGGQITARERTNGNLAAGNVYTVVSYTSDADELSLRNVPLPSVASPATPQTSPDYFDPAVVAAYTQLPQKLDPRIKELAEQITASSTTMYDKVSALESYLRTNYTYDTTITSPPPGDEAAAWFLFQSKRGFCNYFATAMTLMARELGLPARVAAGYTSGTYNSKTNLWTVVGTNAHAWTQIYFANYGWINFEPSATFAAFARPLAPANATPGLLASPSGVSTPTKNPNRLPTPQYNGFTGGPQDNSTSGADQIRLEIEAVLLILVLCILGGLIYLLFWWRRQFRGLSLLSQVYGRVSVLADWAGIPRNRAQTPHEYMQALTIMAPEESVIFERLGDIYVRERWADPESSDHPRRSGEIAEIPGLWRSLQPHLVRYVLRHPYVLQTLPAQFKRGLSRLFFRRSRNDKSTVVVEEEVG